MTTWSAIPSQVYLFNEQYLVVFEKKTFANGTSPQCYYYGPDLEHLVYGAEYSYGMFGLGNYDTYHDQVTLRATGECEPMTSVQWRDNNIYSLKRVGHKQPVTVPAVTSFPLQLSLQTAEDEHAANMEHLRRVGVLL